MPVISGLTSREREILELVAAGRSNPEIAVELYVSVDTVKTDVRHILAKLEAKNRVDAARVWWENHSNG